MYTMIKSYINYKSVILYQQNIFSLHQNELFTIITATCLATIKMMKDCISLFS